MSEKLPYYNFDRIMSYNAPYMIVSGARGLGKTYGAKRIAIRDFVRKGRQFIYLRRYRTELKGNKTFFDDIAGEFPEWEFSVFGREARMRVKGDKEWQVCGFFHSLSTSQANKSIAYPNVYTIIFDEFILDNAGMRYLPDEVSVFNGFYNTVDRYNDRVRVFFLSNAVSITNPYFIEWDIMPETEWGTRADGFIAFHFPDSTAFKSAVRTTRFGKFITEHNARYAEYAIDNKFSDNTHDYVGRKSGRARYVMTIRTLKGRFSVWQDFPNFFIQVKRPKGNELLICTEDCNPIEGEVVLPRGSNGLGMLRTAYRQGLMYFDTPQTRNIFREIFRR